MTRLFEVQELARFVAAGVGNTVVTVAVYQLAVGTTNPVWAYALAWGTGIALVVAFYPTAIFRRRRSMRLGFMLAALYAGIFVLGASFTALLYYIGVHDRYIIFLMLPATTALGYLGSRFLVRRYSRTVTSYDDSR